MTFGFRDEETSVGETVSARFASDGAQSWLSRFAPALDASSSSDPARLRSAIASLRTLRHDAPAVIDSLAGLGTDLDVRLLSTLREASAQIDSLETTLRRRLAKVAPGDPDGIVDLDELRADLAESAARQELGVAPIGETSQSARVDVPLTMTVATPNIAAAGGMGLFGLAWTSFTVFHSLLMIGGMWKAFGPIALLLLLFYAMFYAVGFGMLAGAISQLATETFSLSGDTLTVRRKTLGFVKERSARLSASSRASAVKPTIRQKGASNLEIAVVTADGGEFRFGRGASAQIAAQAVQRLNEALSGR